MSRDLWYGTSGPKDASIVLVGESWGTEELQAQRPFVGSSGVELNRMLAEGGLSREDILCTNVVAEKPQNNEMWRLFVPKSTASNTGVETMRDLSPGDLVRNEVSRLYNQIDAFPRKLVIGTGNYALWALSNCSGETILRASNNRSIAKEDQRAVPNGIMKLAWKYVVLRTIWPTRNKDTISSSRASSSDPTPVGPTHSYRTRSQGSFSARSTR